MLTLYSFSHSSASMRVRVAMHLKGVPYETEQVSLLDGSHRTDAYRAVNPNMRVPTLITPDGPLTQSLAILSWLEATYPAPSIFPATAYDKARALAFAHAIAADIFPLQNLGTRQKLGRDFGLDMAGQAKWSAEVIATGFAGLEAELAARGWQPGGWLFGDAPSVAEICLVPQMNNARRYGVDLAAFPLLVAADAAARAHPAFVAAAPDAA